jgi:photosystem II stability/assembly factor-like uncharacterized protein
MSPIITCDQTTPLSICTVGSASAETIADEESCIGGGLGSVSADADGADTTSVKEVNAVVTAATKTVAMRDLARMAIASSPEFA